MIRITLLFFLLIMPKLIFCQTLVRVDSLVQQGNFVLAKDGYKTLLNESIQKKDSCAERTITLVNRYTGVLVVMNELDLALKITKSFVFCEKQGVRLYNTLGVIYDLKSNHDSAQYYYKKTLLLPDSLVNKATINNNLGVLNDVKGNFSASIFFYRKALSLYNDKVRKARTANNIAKTYRALGKTDSATHFYNLSLKLNSKEYSYLNQFHALESLISISEIKPSLQTILKADSLAKVLRKNIIRRRDKLRLLRESKRLFDVAITKLYFLYKESEDTRYLKLFFYFSERSKANVLLDQIVKKTALDIPIITLSEARARLRVGQVILQFTHADKGLYVLVASKKSVAIKKLFSSKTREQLYEMVNEFRFACQSLDVEDFIEQSPELYNKLIRPILPMIKGKERLLIIPTSEMTNLPFEAFISNKLIYNEDDPLPEMKKAKYLLYDFIVSYHVSSTLAFRFSKQRYRLDYLGIGYNKFQGSLEDLKYSEEEVADGGKNFELSEVYLGDKSVGKQKFTTANSRIVHISTHGAFREERLAGLYIPSPVGLDTLSIEDIFGSKIKTQLVVLSGCHTGQGRIIQNEGLYGFTHAFLYAGTKNIIYSIWGASDKGSLDIMKDFYVYIRETRSLTLQDRYDYAKALTLSKRKYAHKNLLPLLWAGFVINSK